MPTQTDCTEYISSLSAQCERLFGCSAIWRLQDIDDAGEEAGAGTQRQPQHLEHKRKRRGPTYLPIPPLRSVVSLRAVCPTNAFLSRERTASLSADDALGRGRRQSKAIISCSDAMNRWRL